MHGGARKRFDVTAAQALADGGLTPALIAERMGYSKPTVWKAIRDGALRCKLERRRKRDQDEPLQKSAPMPDLSGYPPRTATLIATGGHYADLAAWARDWGVTEIKARQEWHALRMPVRKGGAI